MIAYWYATRFRTRCYANETIFYHLKNNIRTKMSSDSSDEDNVLLYLYYKNKRKCKRRFWVHPYIEKNINCRAFVAARELHENDDEKFRHFVLFCNIFSYVLWQLIIIQTWIIFHLLMDKRFVPPPFCDATRIDSGSVRPASRLRATDIKRVVDASRRVRN